MTAHSLSLPSVEQSQDRDALHHTRRAVAEELAPRFQCTVNSDVVFRRHEEVGRLGWVMRRLLGDVVALRAIRVIPPACENLAQDGVEWFFNASVALSSACCMSSREETKHTVV